ncbi:MAG: 3-hydroxyacyl-CoA dehydrogenase family protein [Promethearchaeota archaeon]
MSNEIKNVSVIGIGFLGRLITEKTALYNYNVRIYDINPEGLEKLAKSLTRKKKRKNLFGEVSFHNTLSEAVADADLIIEAVPEKLELKKEIFSKIDTAAPPHAIIATNSSSIPVSRIENVVQRKDKVLNIHFYHPTITPMVDIMRGSETSEDTFKKGKNWIESLELTPLEVKKECLGFVFNRIWRAIKKECLKIWAGGNAEIEIVDKAWKIYTGMGVGPFSLMDMVGLDVVYDIEMSYFNESGDPNDKPPQALKDMVDRGELGRKSGKGFYEY